MVDKLDSIQMQRLDGCVQNADEVVMSQFHHELSQSFTHIKNNIQECIQSLEHSIQIKPSLIYSMRNTMHDIERARQMIDAIKKSIGIELPQL